MTTTANYSVCIFGSNPDLDNDDCWVGVDFDDAASALAAYQDPQACAEFATWFRHHPATEGEYVVLDGVDAHFERPFRKGEWTLSRRQVRIDDGSYAALELQWERRMLHGCADEL